MPRCCLAWSVWPLPAAAPAPFPLGRAAARGSQSFRYAFVCPLHICQARRHVAIEGNFCPVFLFRQVVVVVVVVTVPSCLPSLRAVGLVARCRPQALPGRRSAQKGLFVRNGRVPVHPISNEPTTHSAYACECQCPLPACCFPAPTFRSGPPRRFIFFAAGVCRCAACAHQVRTRGGAPVGAWQRGPRACLHGTSHGHGLIPSWLGWLGVWPEAPNALSGRAICNLPGLRAVACSGRGHLRHMTRNAAFGWRRASGDVGGGRCMRTFRACRPHSHGLPTWQGWVVRQNTTFPASPQHEHPCPDVPCLSSV